MFDFTGRYFQYFSVIKSLNFCLTFNLVSRYSNPQGQYSINLGRFSSISLLVQKAREYRNPLKQTFNCYLKPYSTGIPNLERLSRRRGSMIKGERKLQFARKVYQNQFLLYCFKKETRCCIQKDSEWWRVGLRTMTLIYLWKQQRKCPQFMWIYALCGLLGESSVLIWEYYWLTRKRQFLNYQKRLKTISFNFNTYWIVRIFSPLARRTIPQSALAIRQSVLIPIPPPKLP